MYLPSRLTVVVCGLLAILTPALGVALAGQYTVAEGRQFDPVLCLLYWPAMLLGALPGRIGAALAGSPFLQLLMYFVAYLLVDQLVRAALRGLRRPGGQSSDRPA